MADKPAGRSTGSTLFYAVAGAGDLVLEKLRDASKYAEGKLSELPIDSAANSADLRGRLERGLAAVRSDVVRLPDDLRQLPDEVRSLSGRAQRAADQAFAQAGETFHELAQRGRNAVGTPGFPASMPQLGQDAAATIRGTVGPATDAQEGAGVEEVTDPDQGTDSDEADGRRAGTGPDETNDPGETTGRDDVDRSL